MYGGLVSFDIRHTVPARTLPSFWVSWGHDFWVGSERYLRISDMNSADNGQGDGVAVYKDSWFKGNITTTATNSIITINGANAALYMGNRIKNNMIVLWATAGTTNLGTNDTAFFGFGIESSTLRYNVENTGHAHKFYAATTLCLTVNTTGITSAGEVTAFSDARLKSNVVTIASPLQKIANIGGYTFDRVDIGTRQAGVIAQELLPELPEAVRECNGNLAVSYAAVTALCVEGIRELVRDRDALAARVSAAEDALADIRRRLNIP